MSKKTVKRGANKVQEPPKLNPNLDSMNFWRELALQVVPELKDKADELGELAVILQQNCKQWSNEWASVSKICNKTADTKIKVGFGVTIDRCTQPSEVGTTSSYAEKHGMDIKSQVPDPNQDELPGMSDIKEGDTGDGAGLGEPPAE